MPDFGKWVEAEDLEPGMWLQTAAGTWVQITAIDTAHCTQRVHNLTVEGQHTYFVLAGSSPVLVHNRGAVPLNCQSSQLAQRSMQARMTNRVQPSQNVAVYQIGPASNRSPLNSASTPAIEVVEDRPVSRRST
ncbi:Hint domain-containing protein [Streptomyces sp. HMX87]|uniref:Hint domain-containing protein n=1 Tax=Streptomyces sp. HMX87 TaxID=3390849 RepID=UPI003A8ADCBC